MREGAERRAREAEQTLVAIAASRTRHHGGATRSLAAEESTVVPIAAGVPPAHGPEVKRMGGGRLVLDAPAPPHTAKAAAAVRPATHHSHRPHRGTASPQPAPLSFDASLVSPVRRPGDTLSKVETAMNALSRLEVR